MNKYAWIKKKIAPRPKTRQSVFGLVVGVPEPSVDMGMLIVQPPPTLHPKENCLCRQAFCLIFSSSLYYRNVVLQIRVPQ